jgi:hypothetical protein
VFTEGGDSDSGDEDEMMATPLTKSGYSQLQLEEEESRDRSQSTGSEQIGRFEVHKLASPSLFSLTHKAYHLPLKGDV